jgi:hypothetical protein
MRSSGNTSKKVTLKNPGSSAKQNHAPKDDNGHTGDIGLDAPRDNLSPVQKYP